MDMAAGWPDWGKCGRASAAITCFFVILAWLIGTEAVAKPVGPGEVRQAVAGWLGKGRQHLGRRLGREIESIETYRGEQARPVYYIVNLKSGGFLIVSGDDLVEPIIGIVSGGSYDASDENPLGALVSRDVHSRMEAVRADRGADMRGLDRAAEKARSKWTQLIAYDGNTVGTEGYSFISEVWVEPLLQSEWGQSTECGRACYNYYTPPYEPCDVDNYPSGCIATAMAQLMRCHQFPTAGIGVNGFTIVVDGSSETAYTRGGDGSGGAYAWSEMVLEPGCDSNDLERQAIGSLCYDAGISVEMDYSSGGSGAYVHLVKDALLDTFTYSNAIDGWNNNDNIGPGLTGMLNPDLDAGLPALLGISNDVGQGHAVVADGYGYDGSTLYHHLNMGWQGFDDTWYNLPNIDSSPAFSSVHEVIYNIYVSETGEIISGRVTDVRTDLLVEGATVTAVRTGGGTYAVTTNSNGIYAIVGVPSNSDYTVSAVKPEYSFTDKPASTGSSQDDQAVAGNCWGVDFAGLGSGPLPPIAFDGNVVTGPGTAVEIALEALDEGLPGMLSYVITSLPSYGVLSDPCAGDINSTPYVLADDGNRVVYTPGGCQEGSDDFQFKANDGGTSPDGGESNIATVTVEVISRAPVIYETGFDGGLDVNFSVVDGGSSSDTWMSSNPGGRSSPYWTGTFMIVDSDWAGYEDLDEQLITPSIDCSGFMDVVLKFNHKFKGYSGYEVGDVDVRISGGPWQNVEWYQGADYYVAEGEVELPLSGFGADGASDVQVRWHYYDAYYDYYWGIDDVQISGMPESPEPAVGDFNRDCVVDYYDLCLFTSTWLRGLGEPGYNADCDLSGDDFVDGVDFAGFAQNWLVTAE